MSPRSSMRSALSVVFLVAATAGGGVAAQHATEPIAEPVRFEARWSAIQANESEAWAVDGIDPLHEINGEWPVKVTETSDPRLAGEVTYAYNNDRYRSIDLQVHHSAFRISNDLGTWQERPAAILGHPDLRPSTRTGVFDGAGAYEGLVAVAELAWDPVDPAWDVHGYIIEGGFPPLPGEGSVPE